MLQQEAVFVETTAAYIERDLLRRPLALTAETPLIASGLIDSLTLFRLVDFVQRQFGVRVEPAEITIENFATLADIARLVAARQGA